MCTPKSPRLAINKIKIINTSRPEFSIIVVLSTSTTSNHTTGEPIAIAFSLIILSISLPFEFLGPVFGKFMVGVVGYCTLQPMARTNHKFPGCGGGGGGGE